jgi:archaellum component FlaF (FlaF/FlaG flagellin family)
LTRLGSTPTVFVPVETRPELRGSLKTLRVLAVVTALAISAISLPAAGFPDNFKTRRMSVRSNGDGANANSWNVDVSANGRFVAFISEADNLVPDDGNSRADVFVHNRKTGKTRRVSVRSNGDEGDEDSGYSAVAISATGRFVAFDSEATDLVGGDTLGNDDIFVHDRSTGKTRRVSVRSNGDEGDSDSYTNVDISADGKFVAFSSEAENLVPGDDNAHTDVFVHNQETHKTRRVSVRSNGDQADQGDPYSGDYAVAISATGRFVAFDSGASDLVSDDDNGNPDIFVHDRSTGKTRRVSVRSNGEESDGESYENVDISADGKFVAFPSNAFNLVPNDDNGYMDVFVHNRTTGKTRRVSLRSNGDEADDDSGFGSGGYYDTMLRISATGRFVAFASKATNLVGGDTLGYMDVFIHDRKTGMTRRVSVKANGDEGDDGSGEYGVAMTSDGRFVGYASYATNLAPGDANGSGYDIYLSGPLR